MPLNTSMIPLKKLNNLNSRSNKNNIYLPDSLHFIHLIITAEDHNRLYGRDGILKYAGLLNNSLSLHHTSAALQSHMLSMWDKTGSKAVLMGICKFDKNVS